MIIRINRKELFVSFKVPKLAPVGEEPPRENWTFILIYLLALVASVGAWSFYYLNNLTLSYNDARSHLNVSRRVVNSLQPGFAQLGSVWLPLQHVLQLPTIGFDYMYRTGLSGSIVSMIAFILSTIIIYQICRELGVSKIAAAVGTIAFCFNQNILFMQSTPMTEPLMIFTILASFMFFLRWVKYDKLGQLILASLFTFLACLTRYDGWFLLVFMAFSVAFISLLRHNWYKAESRFILYATLAALAPVLWLLWNQLIFGDWLYFVNGTFSAKAQQDILFSEGLLKTKGNLPFSSLTYLYTVIFNAGLPLFILGVAGVLFFLFSKKSTLVKIALFTLISPVFFNIISLYLGQSVIHLPNIPPYSWFNVRYGLLSLPILAVGVALLVADKKPLAVLAVAVILLNFYWMYSSNNIITVQDGVRGSSGYYLDDVGAWLNHNARDGLILLAASSHDALIFVSGLPSKRFITEGAEKYWNASLEDPTRYATYVVMHGGDLVYKKLNNNPLFIGHFRLVYSGEFSSVYKKI